MHSNRSPQPPENRTGEKPGPRGPSRGGPHPNRAQASRPSRSSPLGAPAPEGADLERARARGSVRADRRALTSASGQGIGGAPIQVLASTPISAERPVAVLRTDAN